MRNHGYIVAGFIIIAIIILLFIFVNKRQLKPNEELVTTTHAATAHASAWIKERALTYVYDGSELTHIDTRALDCSGCYSSTFTFVSAHSGYGKRANVVTLQLISPHIIEIMYRSGRLFSATTDGEFDELNQKLLNEKPLMSVNVYFGDSKDNPNAKDCAKVFPVERITDLKNPPYQSSLELLLQGPTEQEKLRGYSTAIDSNVKLRKFYLEGDIAHVDISKLSDGNTKNFCKVEAFRAQITKTLKEFTNIKYVIISVEGKILESS